VEFLEIVPASLCAGAGDGDGEGVDGTPVGEIGARGELGVGFWHLCGLANGFGREGAAGEHVAAVILVISLVGVVFVVRDAVGSSCC
jgi:hypothetical protein